MKEGMAEKDGQTHPPTHPPTHTHPHMRTQEELMWDCLETNSRDNMSVITLLFPAAGQMVGHPHDTSQVCKICGLLWCREYFCHASSNPKLEHGANKPG